MSKKETLKEGVFVWGSIITVFMLALSIGYLLGGKWSLSVYSDEFDELCSFSKYDNDDSDFTSIFDSGTMIRTNKTLEKKLKTKAIKEVKEKIAELEKQLAKLEQ